MEPDNKKVDWLRYGLGAENGSRWRTNGNTSGFVDLGNEYDYGAGGHQASGANELFAEEQVIHKTHWPNNKTIYLKIYYV